MRTHRVLTALVALGLGATGLALISPAEAAHSRCSRTNNSIRKLLECVTLEGVLEHEQAFQDIADENGGTRASGTPGYDASVDYVARPLTAAGYNVTSQEFPFLRVRGARPVRPPADRAGPVDLRRGHRLRGHAALRAG